MKKISFLFISALYCLANDSCVKKSDELINLINNHPNIKMSEEKIKGSNERIDSAYAGYLPTLSIEGSLRDNDRKSESIRLEQPIWTGGKISSKYELEKNLKESNIYQLKETYYNLTEEIINLISEYKKSEIAELELKEGLTNLNKFKEILERRITAGISPESDMELLKSRIEQINSSIVLEKTKNQISKNQIENLLDEKICQIEINNKNIENNLLEKDIEEMLSFHPSLKKIEEEKKATINEMEGIKAKLLPDVSFIGEHRQGNLYSENDNKTDNQNLVYLNIKAKFGVNTVSDISEKRIKITELEYKRKGIEKDLIKDLYKDYDNNTMIKERIEVIERSIVSAQKVLESYERLFLAGKRSWLDVANSLKEVMNYKIELSDLKIEQKIISYNLNLKKGNINIGENK